MRLNLPEVRHSRDSCEHGFPLPGCIWAAAALLVLTVVFAGSASPARATSQAGALTPGLEAALKGTVVVRAGTSEGSGFMLGDSGCLLTAAHVVGSATAVTVIHDGAANEAERIAGDDQRDLALFCLTLSPPSSGLLLAGSNQAQVGMDVYVIGTPLGQEGTVTKGIISAASRVQDGVELIQVDAAVNPGNSGGPIVDSEGRVVALTTQMMADAQSLGYGVSGGEIRAFLAEAGLDVSSAGEVTWNTVPVAGDAAPTSQDDVANGSVPSASSTWTHYWWLLLFGAGAGIVAASIGLLLFFHFRKPKSVALEKEVRITLAEPVAIGTRSAEGRTDNTVPSEDAADLDITLQDSLKE